MTEKCVQNYQEEVDALHADKIAFEGTLLYGLVGRSRKVVGYREGYLNNY